MGNFGKTGIQRHFENIRKTDPSVTTAVPVLDHPAADIQRAGIVENLGRIDEVLLKSGCRHHRLEGRTRFIDTGNRTISPDLIRIAPKPVGVIAGPIGHRQNLAGFRIHHDHGGGLRFGPFHRPVKNLLHGKLDRTVDGQINRVAAFRLGKRINRLEDRRPLAVGIQNLSMGLAADRFIHRHFQSVQAFIVNADKTQNMRRQLLVGIYPPAFFLKVQSLNLFLADESTDLFELLRFERPLEPHKGPLRFQPVQQLFFRQVQQDRQFSGENFRLLDLTGIGEQRFGHVADRHFLAGAVENRSPRRLQNPAFLQLVPGLLRPVLRFIKLQPAQTDHQDQQTDQQKDTVILKMSS